MPNSVNGPASRAASLLHGRPLALRRDMVGTSYAALAGALASQSGQDGMLRRIARHLGLGRALRPAAARLSISAGDPRPYGEFANGVAVIGIEGVLLDRAIFYSDWETGEPCLCVDGYDRIWAAIEAAMADDQVAAILLRIASPGGLVTGCFELCAKIAGIAAKPVVAYLADYAFSAGYAIACSASAIVAAESGSCGSIGVLAVHESYAAFLEAHGVATTFIESHRLKSAGDPAKPLEPAAAAMMQEGVDAAAVQFVAHVAARRGLAPEAVDAFEAGWFTADAALANGLIDGVGGFDEALAALQADAPSFLALFHPEISPDPDPSAVAPPEGAPVSKSENEMKTKPKLSAKKPGAGATAQVEDDKADAAEAEGAPVDEEDEDEPDEDGEAGEGGAPDEATRISRSPLAAKHPALALAAIRSKMTFRQFEAAVKASGGSKSGTLDARMQAERPLGPDGPKASPGATVIDAKGIYASRRKTAARARNAA